MSKIITGAVVTAINGKPVKDVKITEMSLGRTTIRVKETTPKKPKAVEIIGRCVGASDDGGLIWVEVSNGAVMAMPPPPAPNESVTCQMLRERVTFLEKEMAEAKRNQRKAEEFAAQKRSEAESFRQRLSRYEEINERGSSVGLIPPRYFLSPSEQYMRQMMMQEAERMLYQTIVVGADEPVKPAGPKPPEPKRGRMHNLDLDDVEKGK